MAEDVITKKQQANTADKKPTTEQTKSSRKAALEAERSRLARAYIQRELGNTVEKESEMAKQSNKRVDELSPTFYTKRVEPRMHEIHKYYTKQGVKYGIAGAMMIGGAAAFLAPWGLPFILAGAGVAAAGATLAVGTRVTRNDDYNVSLDIATARMAWRESVLINSVGRDLEMIADAEKKGLNSEHIRIRAEKKMDKLERATKKAYDKAKRKLKKFDSKQVALQKSSVRGGVSLWAGMLGVKRWTNKSEKIRARLDNDMHLHISELIKINYVRNKLGLPISTEADTIVKKHEAEVLEARRIAAKTRMDRAEQNTWQTPCTLEEHDKNRNSQAVVFENEFAKRLHKPTFSDKQVAMFITDPASLSYPRAFEILFNEKFGTTEAEIEIEKKQSFPIFPKVKNWETGEVELDEQGKPVLTTYTEVPKFGYAPITVSMSIEEADSRYADYGLDVDKTYYHVLDVDGEKVEVYTERDEVFVLRQPTKKEIHDKKLKPEFLHVIERNTMGIPQFDKKTGSVKFKEEYETEQIAESKEQAWPEVAVQDGKLVRGKNFNGSLDGYLTVEDLNYTETKVSKVESREGALLVGFILKHASEEELKQIGEIYAKMPEDTKDILRNDPKFARVVARVREFREGIDTDISIYDNLCAQIGEGARKETRIKEIEAPVR